jgi:uncharacterized integral membrane protein
MRRWPAARHPLSKGGVTRRDDDHQDDDPRGDAFDPQAGQKDPEFGTYRKEGVSPGVVALIVAAVLLLIFVLQNDEQRPINFLFWHFYARTWVALLVAAVLGFAVGFLVHWLRRRNRDDRAR